MWLTRNAQTDAPQRNVSGPCTTPGVSPLFHPGQRSGDVVVPQGRALVNSKPYPACLFFWRGRVRLQMPLGYKYQYCSGVCPCQAVKSGTPPHKLNRRQYGAGILSSAFRGRRPVEYPRNTSGVQSPESKRRIVLLLAEPTRKKPRRQELSGPGPESCAWPAADTQPPTPHRTEHGVRWQYQELRR